MEDNKSEVSAKEITTLNQQFTKKQIQEFQHEQKRVIYRRRRLTVVFAVAIVFFIVSGINFVKSYQHIAQLEAEKQAVTKEQTTINETIAALEYEVDLLGDQEYLQKLARHKYYYTKDGEIVFNIPQLNSSTKSSTEESNSQQETDSTK